MKSHISSMNLRVLAFTAFLTVIALLGLSTGCTAPG